MSLYLIIAKSALYWYHSNFELNDSLYTEMDKRKKRFQINLVMKIIKIKILRKRN